MSTLFKPVGTLNVAIDATDLKDGDFTRCKNLRINEKGKAVTRDGSAKINSSAIDTDIWHIEEQEGKRYVFAGGEIYEDESSIVSGLTSAQWSSIKYNAFNDSTKQIFATNGTDRKRIADSVVSEWGIDPPTVPPVLTTGDGNGLTGQYNAVYTYVRKVGKQIVAESGPSPAATANAVLDDQSLAVEVEQPSDSQITHIRLYRTLQGGETYFFDLEVPVETTYSYGYVQAWESDEGYISGTGFNFTVADGTNDTENCFTWEEFFGDRDDEDESTQGSQYQDFLDEFEEQDRRDRYRLPWQERREDD